MNCISCQPASGGHTHIQDDDLATFEYFFKRFPNFLGWNYAEQFWGFDEAGDMSSSTQSSRIALFIYLNNYRSDSTAAQQLLFPGRLHY